MPDPATIAAFAAASFALLIIPGPAVLYVVNRSVSDGRRVGLAAVAGLELGNLAHVVAAAAGLSAVLAASATAFTAVKWLGALYLVGVGIVTLARRPTQLGLDASTTTPARALAQGVVVNVLNPKVALFFLSFLPQFIDPARGTAGAQALVLGAVFVAIGACTDSVYSLIASTLRAALARGRVLPFVQRWLAGTVFIGLGLTATTATAVRTTP